MLTEETKKIPTSGPNQLKLMTKIRTGKSTLYVGEEEGGVAA